MEENIGSKNANYFTTFFLQLWCWEKCGEEKIMRSCISEKQPSNVCHVKDVAKKLWNSLVILEQLIEKISINKILFCRD